MADLLISPKFYGWTENGHPASGGKLYTYQAGDGAGTTLLKTTWSDANQTVANTNPVILNDEGFADVYLDGEYYLVFDLSDDTTVWSKDNVRSSSTSIWVDGSEATYITPKSFSILGNKTDAYAAERALQVRSGTSTYTYTHVESSTYASGTTTVKIEDVIDSAIEFVAVSAVTKESIPSNLDLTKIRIGHNLVKNPDKKLKKSGFNGNYLHLANNEMGDLCWMRSSDPEEHYQYIPEEEIVGGQYCLSWNGGGFANVDGVPDLRSGDVVDLFPDTGNVKILLPTTATRIKFEEGPRNTGDENRAIDIERVVCAPYFREFVAVAIGDYLGIGGEQTEHPFVIRSVYSMQPPMFGAPELTFSGVSFQETGTSTHNLVEFSEIELSSASKYAVRIDFADTVTGFTLDQDYELRGHVPGGYVRLDANIRSN